MKLDLHISTNGYKMLAVIKKFALLASKANFFMNLLFPGILTGNILHFRFIHIFDIQKNLLIHSYPHFLSVVFSRAVDPFTAFYLYFFTEIAFISLPKYFRRAGNYHKCIRVLFFHDFFNPRHQRFFHHTHNNFLFLFTVCSRTA